MTLIVFATWFGMSKILVSKKMGSLNFSRIDNSQLQFTLNDTNINTFKSFLPANQQSKGLANNFDITIYGVNYNYLVIKGGMGGLVYNN